MPRPRLPKSEYRGSFVRVRLTTPEKTAVTQAAKRNAAKLSDWVRAVILDAAAKR